MNTWNHKKVYSFGKLIINDYTQPYQTLNELRKSIMNTTLSKCVNKRVNQSCVLT